MPIYANSSSWCSCGKKKEEEEYLPMWDFAMGPIPDPLTMGGFSVWMSWFDTWRENNIYWAWKRQELQNNNNNSNRYCLQHHLQCKETRALRDPSWIFFCSMIFMLWDTFSPTSWINFLCLPEPRMSIFFFCFLDRIYCTSSEQRFGCWQSKVLFCNGVSPHLLWIAEQ